VAKHLPYTCDIEKGKARHLEIRDDDYLEGVLVIYTSEFELQWILGSSFALSSHHNHEPVFIFG
jgi:hypothetical protein